MDGGLQHCIQGGDQNHPKEKEMQKAKWFSEKRQQIAEKKREVKERKRSKGEKERYTHLNAKFQRIARREEKSLLQ